MVFIFNWCFDAQFQDRILVAKHRCAVDHFPDLKPEKAEKDPKYKEFFDELEARTILYLRDGFSYEIKEIMPGRDTMTLTFECVAADEAYKVGCFVVTVPFEDIVRVEVFSVHPEEKPEDMPAIKGFASAQGSPVPTRPDERSQRSESPE